MSDFEKRSRSLEEGETFDSSTCTAQNSPTSATNASMSIQRQRTASWNPPPSIAEEKRPLWSRIVAPLLPAASDSESSFDEEEPDHREIRVRTLQRFPRGYPCLATFADSAEEFMVYRRFGYLQSRLLLEKQDELRLLEERVDAMDETDMYEEPDSLFSRESQGEERKKLLMEVEGKFCQYAQLVQAAQQLTSANRPTRSEHKSMMNFMTGHPVNEPEAEYVLHKEDLITLRPGREHAWLERGIEKCLKMLRCSALAKIFGSPESIQKSSPKEVYFCKQKISAAASGVITIMILFLLIVPIYLLYHLVERAHGLLMPRDTAICIGILLVFTLIFSAVMSLFTRARRHEILGAAAAYCAVLVVFLGNVGNN